MFDHRTWHGLLGWLRGGWLVVAGLYVIAAVLVALLAGAMRAWWPVALALASAGAAAGCIRAGLASRLPAHPPQPLRAARRTVREPARIESQPHPVGPLPERPARIDLRRAR